MKKDKSDEPRDEFDRIQIPEFLARPFERLGGGPAPAAPVGRDGVRSADAAGPGTTELPDDAPADDEQPAPRAWWAGYRGKLLLYGAGTLVMVFLQSRGR
ncbi:hypothetical protein [Cryobacterium sp. PAMC25264]|uniref:hypothetical protein n=1 Tax=Cryobacterium sp. PAMC25264 TaxID=2861288 RepID=UPI001C626317|nr:hypothetical protein [Cryobacterium sp. PAMC25264]QYF72486.1 hypothetical protein KY500_11650 [Cryobacterium sp. PAMC25264]